MRRMPARSDAPPKKIYLLSFFICITVDRNIIYHYIIGGLAAPTTRAVYCYEIVKQG